MRIGLRKNERDFSSKPRGTKLNPKKRRSRKRASPAQLAARAKFAAMAKAKARAGQRAYNKRRAKEKAPGKLTAKQKAARRSTNPKRRGYFQVAAAKGKNVLFLAGLGLSSNRDTASNFGTVSTARKMAGQVRDVGRPLGVARVAVVTSYDSPQAIRRFLLGEA
jgi:hypothetical protein